MHENLERDEVVKGSSERAFGLVFFVAFVIGLAPWLEGHRRCRIWALVLAIVLTLALF